MLFSVPIFASAATITMGETTVLPSTDSGNGNLLLVQDATLSQSGTLQSLSFYVRTANGNLRLGVYDSTGPSGGPGALKAQTNSFVPVAGWNTQSVITPVQLPVGNYWLAYLPSSSNLTFATNFTIGSYKQANFTFGAMPATFPAVGGSGTTHWSLYASLDTNTTPDTSAPTVPTNLSATPISQTQINLSWSASTDNVGVVGYNVVRDGAAIATTTSTSFSNTGLTANTLYSYAVRAYDAASNYSALSASVATTTLPTPPADTTAPTVSLTAPANGATVSATISVSATASDNVGVIGVQFKLDGANLGAEDTTSPYSVSWDTTTAPNGSHSLTAVARDAVGNSATSTAISVTVSNTPPVLPLYRASGTFTFSTGAITPPYPTSMAAGDVCLLAVESENQAISLSSAQGFVEVPTWSPQSAGTAAVNPASRLALFWKRTVGSDIAPTAADSGNHTTGRIHCFSNVASLGNPWDVGNGGNDGAANDTSGTVPGATTSFANTLVVLFTSTSFNGTSSTQCSAWSNASLVNITERFDNTNTVGLGGGHCMATGEKAAAGSYGTTNVTLANTTFKGAVSLALKSNQSAPDTTPPSIPTGLTATPISATQIDLAWNASTDNVLVTGYKVFQGGLQIGATTAANRAFSHTGLTALTIYSYNVSAYDASGNVSGLSATTTATTLPPPDTTPPTISIDSPISGAQVYDIVTVTAQASDNVAVTGVQFYLDGTAIGLEDTGEPFGVNWDTRTTTNGAHTLTARARDAAGNAATSTGVTVNVVNSSFFQNEILVQGFNLPTAIKFLPDGRMLVSELPGNIKVVPPPYTSISPTLFLQLNLNITGYAGYQQGIFDFVLDPDFINNHYYYVFYTKDVPNKDRLSRFTANATLDGTVPGSELILYEDPQLANTEHHGGALNFGNDGKLYFTTGEHFQGSPSQDLTSPRGKVHRINPDGTAPTDNPFYDGAGPNWDSVWALGLRNPFRAYYDAPTNRLLVADVGGNDYSTAYEEVDLAQAGKNFGWPNCEFGTCGNPAYTPALYAYPHNGRDASITGGFVYHGSQFPSGYQGSYFFADYAQNWIRRLTFDQNGNVNGVFNFEPADGSLDGPYGDIVYLAEGPDSALYYVDLGYSDVGGPSVISNIRRIRYVSSNQAPTAIASASPTSGPAPLTVNFSSASSTDPEGQPLTYLWTFGDGATSSVANPVHTYVNSGQYTVRLTTSDGVNTTLGAPFIISAGNPPVPTIFSPVASSTFVAADVISFSGDATDTEDGVLPATAFSWTVDFLHAGHVHPGGTQTGIKSGTFTIPTSGHDFSGNTRYRFTLTVTDSNGLQTSTSTIVYPSKVNLTFDTLPSTLTLYLDGIAKQTTFVYDTLIGFVHTIEARDSSTATTTYTFASWSDGGAQTHAITVPAAAQTYTATYSVATSSTPFTIGETTQFSSTDSGNGNLLLVQDAVLLQPGFIQSLSFYVLNVSGNLRLGIYDATGPSGGPGQLKAQTNSFVPVSGWNTQSAITPVQLAPGNYWLAYFPSDNNLSFATNFSIGSYKFANLTFGAMPTTFPAINGQGTTHWSLYGTLTP